jgi:hypothetical protein
MKTSYDGFYMFKVWLTTMIAGPFIHLIFLLLFSGNSFANLLEYYFMLLLFGLLFSLPGFIIYLIIANLLEHLIKDIFWFKKILGLFALMLLFLTFYFLRLLTTGDELKSGFLLLFYSICIILASSIYKLEKEADIINEQV